MKNKQNKLLQDNTRIQSTEFGFRPQVVGEGVRFSAVHSVTVRAGCNWKNPQAVPSYAEEIVRYWHASAQSI